MRPPGVPAPTEWGPTASRNRDDTASSRDDDDDPARTEED
jgi:hypothetical protein